MKTWTDELHIDPLDPETAKRAQLYQLIEELVLSEHARTLSEDDNGLDRDEGHIVKDPTGHRC